MLIFTRVSFLKNELQNTDFWSIVLRGYCFDGQTVNLFEIPWPYLLLDYNQIGMAKNTYTFYNNAIFRFAICTFKKYPNKVWICMGNFTIKTQHEEKILLWHRKPFKKAHFQDLHIKTSTFSYWFQHWIQITDQGSNLLKGTWLNLFWPKLWFIPNPAKKSPFFFKRCHHQYPIN